jgi:hypothetical protein
MRNADFEALERDWGIVLPEAVDYVKPEYARNFALAMDAQPALVTVGNSGIPAFLTTMIDPSLIRVLQAPMKGAEILGETRKGTWVDQTAMFPIVEQTGEVSSYGDYSENGSTGVNINWPQRQSYLFQTRVEYGELELERAGLARISLAAEKDQAAALSLNKFADKAYHLGIAGLQNYGLLNDPSLSAALTPATKAAGGTKWILNGVINATANEVFADIQAMYNTVITQSQGAIDASAKMVLALSPSSEVALTITNSFNVNVYDLLKKNFPNIRVVSDTYYAASTNANPYGNAAGNLVQLIAESVEGQDTGYCAFNEKMRAHPVIRAASSFRQKKTAGVWGAVIRQPFAIAQMVGV